MNEHETKILKWLLCNGYIGWPNKNGTAYFPYVNVMITGVSGWGPFSWEEKQLYQDQYFLFMRLFSMAYFVRQCRGPKFSTLNYIIGMNECQFGYLQLWAVIHLTCQCALLRAGFWCKTGECTLINLIGLLLTTMASRNSINSSLV